MDELIELMKEQMEKTITSLKSNLQTIRTGRASVHILDKVEVDYYGEPTPLNQVASITIPDPRQIMVKPYSRDDIKAIIAGINAANIGIAPNSDGIVIRLNIPPLTEDRRRELAKGCKKYGEDAKVALRNVRREYMDEIKADKELPEDARKRLEQDVQKVTDEFNKKVDLTVQDKEKEIMTI